MWKYWTDKFTLLLKWLQKVSEQMKKTIPRGAFLVYPNFNYLFVIHMDAIKVKLGVPKNSQCSGNIMY